jgi:hypothetical protein
MHYSPPPSPPLPPSPPMASPPPSPPPPSLPMPPIPSPPPSPPPYDIHMHAVLEDVRVEFGDSFYGMGAAVGSLAQVEHMEAGPCTKP